MFSLLKLNEEKRHLTVSCQNSKETRERSVSENHETCVFYQPRIGITSRSKNIKLLQWKSKTNSNDIIHRITDLSLPIKMDCINERNLWIVYKDNISPCFKGALSGLETIFGNWKPLKNEEKCFLFHLKRSVHSQDIYFFVMTFWSCSKTTSLEK